MRLVVHLLKKMDGERDGLTLWAERGCPRDAIREDRREEVWVQISRCCEGRERSCPGDNPGAGGAAGTEAGRVWAALRTRPEAPGGEAGGQHTQGSQGPGPLCPTALASQPLSAHSVPTVPGQGVQELRPPRLSSLPPAYTSTLLTCPPGSVLRFWLQNPQPPWGVQPLGT